MTAAAEKDILVQPLKARVDDFCHKPVDVAEMRARLKNMMMLKKHLKELENRVEWLARDGCLIIGGTESISGLCPEFEPKRYLRLVFYQLKGSA